jgi:CheY-like chemotaxis protein
VAEAVRLLPDVVMMDVNMPELGGVEASSRILQRERPTKTLRPMSRGPFRSVPTRFIDQYRKENRPPSGGRFSTLLLA